jgi:hypothetical protein
MKIRTLVNEKPIAVLSICGVMLLLAGVMTVRHFSQSGPRVVDRAYYTVDDGKTWFADSIERIPPFEHEGKTAVKVYVFRCGGKPFAGYLERFTEDGQKRAEKFWADTRAKAAANDGKMEIDRFGLMMLAATAGEVKKPGETQWHKTSSAPPSVTRVECPDGGDNKDLELFLP